MSPQYVARMSQTGQYEPLEGSCRPVWVGHATDLLEVGQLVALLEVNHKFIQWPTFQHEPCNW